MAQNLSGKGLAAFAISKIGVPYVYGAKGADGKLTQAKVNSLARMYPNVFTSKYLNKIASKGLVGKVCCDCSGLISWYTGKVLGSSQLYSQAYARLPISKWKDFAVGTVLWKSGHVGVYIGDGYVVEEKGIDYGCVKSKVSDTPWKYGLTFSWIDYTIDTPIPSNNITYKNANIYPEPTCNISKKTTVANYIKWLQYELIEAGYTNVKITGSWNNVTKNALGKFQKSSKLTVDYICGASTRGALIGDNPKMAPLNDSKINPYTAPTSGLFKKGNSGESVKWIQWELKFNGYNIIVNGVFDNSTTSFVTKYQMANKLEVDGKVGSETISSFLSKH